MGHKQATGLALLAAAMFALAGVRDEGVRQPAGQRRERQGRVAHQDGRGDAGAHQGQRGQNQRRRPEGRRRPGLGRRGAQGRGRRRREGRRGRRQGRRRRRGVAEADLQRDAVGRPGRLRASASGSCRTRRRPASTSSSPASRPTARTCTSRSKGTPTRPGPRSSTTSSGLERAEAAMKMYLHDQHQIPLHKISVISYGPDKPVAPNKTKADRAQNRRIVINVLSVGPASTGPRGGAPALPAGFVWRPAPRHGPLFRLPAPGRAAGFCRLIPAGRLWPSVFRGEADVKRTLGRRRGRRSCSPPARMAAGQGRDAERDARRRADRARRRQARGGEDADGGGPDGAGAARTAPAPRTSSRWRSSCPTST